jgi:hypothetical protein
VFGFAFGQASLYTELAKPRSGVRNAEDPSLVRPKSVSVIILWQGLAK